MLSNKLYDLLKKWALVILPALGTCYFALSGIWGWPKGQEVIGTITAIEACLGVLLGVSAKQYQNSDRPYDGNLLVSPEGPESGVSIEIPDKTLEEITAQDKVALRVTSQSVMPQDITPQE